MKPKPVFDILIVYDAYTARSAADLSYTESAPFPSTSSYFNCNATYQYFIQYCKTQKLTTAFTTTADIDAAGNYTSAWAYTTKWKRLPSSGTAKIIFDKFSGLLPRNHIAYDRLISVVHPIPLFHNQVLRIMFDDKLKTYQQFSEYTIPTVLVNSKIPTGFTSAQHYLKLLCSDHRYTEDFTKQFVMKDQFGIGGNHIYKLYTNDEYLKIITATPNTHYILQPFIDASGFNIAQRKGKTDLRVIICNNTIVQSYLRIAKAGEFRANAQQGGEVVYLELDQIPPEVLTMIADIQQDIPSKTALYTLDFAKTSSGHIYFIEGNTMPGLNWFDPEDEQRAKQLIQLIVKNLQERIA